MKRTSQSRINSNTIGQGFAEYAIILAFVAISAMITVTILEPSLGNTFSEIARADPISPPSLVDYAAQETSTPDSGLPPTQTPDGPTAIPTNTATATATYTPTAAPIGNCGLTLEAETAALSGNMVINSNLDPGASGGEYIYIPEGNGDDLTGPNSNSATFIFNITQAETYQFIGYTYAEDADSNSFFVEIDGQRIQWDVEIGTTYGPDLFNDAFGSDPVEKDLSVGQHTIVVSLREDGTRLDKITLECASGVPSPTATPTAPPASDFILPTDNLCIGSTTGQSSDAYSGVSNRACDGDRDGVYNNGSVTHTSTESEAWWEVDLGRIYILQQIKLFNRTDCCANRLSNFYIFISDSPFSSNDLTTTLNDSNVDSFYFEGDVDALAYAFTQQSGRYIRIQLTGSDPLSLAEVEIYGSRDVPPPCEVVVDMFYIFDVSGSMNWDFDGTSTKIEAARDAVINLNNAIAADNPDHRVGFVTFTTSGYYAQNGYWHYPISLNSVPLSTDISATNSIVAGWTAQSGTPTGAALNEGRLTMVQDWDPLRIPIVVLVSDGVPTVDQSELGYSDGDVQNVEVYDTNGDPYTAAYVASTGSGDPAAGPVVADVMLEAQELMNSLPNATMHSIAIGGSGFNTEVLQYVADVGGGSYFNATNSTELSNQLSSIFDNASCGSDS